MTPALGNSWLTSTLDGRRARECQSPRLCDRHNWSYCILRSLQKAALGKQKMTAGEPNLPALRNPVRRIHPVKLLLFPTRTSGLPSSSWATGNRVSVVLQFAAHRLRFLGHHSFKSNVVSRPSLCAWALSANAAAHLPRAQCPASTCAPAPRNRAPCSPGTNPVPASGMARRPRSVAETPARI
jgi:hypothetical protein